MRTSTQRKCLLMAVAFIKYLPVVSCLLFVAHSAFELFGNSDPLLDTLAVTSLPRGVFMVLCSVAFGFCRLHRLFVYYNIIASLLMLAHDSGIDIGALWVHRVIATAIGVTLLVNMAVRRLQFKRIGDVKGFIGTIPQTCCK